MLDTSGAELNAALSAGGVFLLKSSREELKEYAARELVRSGRGGVGRHGSTGYGAVMEMLVTR